MAIRRAAYYDPPLIKIDDYDLSHGRLVKRGNSFYYIDRFDIDMGKIALCCSVTGCEYYTDNYKELFRHLRKVHDYKLLQLPGALADRLSKTGKPG
jgi:hypothetical protein